VATKKFVTFSELPDFGVPKYSRKHLLDLQRRDQFPKALQLSPNRIGWDSEAVRAWVASRPVALSVAEVPGDASGDKPARPKSRRSPRRGRRAGR